MTRDLVAGLKAEGRRLGFSDLGIVKPESTLHLPFYRDWIAGGYHGEMGYLAREDSVARRGDLRLTMAEVRSVVVVTQEYFQEDPPGVPEDPSRAVIARYARGRDYHRVFKGRLNDLLTWVEAEARAQEMDEVEGLSYVDTGPILERDLANRAGLGWFGKNTLLIHPRRGSYAFIGILLLNLDLPSSPGFKTDHCGSCTACLEACPTGALLGRDESGAPVLDARRCISYLTIELKGPIPRELRPLMGNRVFGCDICQECCPFTQKFSRVAAEPNYAARPAWEAEWARDPEDPDDDGPAEAVVPTTDGPALVDLMRMSEDEWDAYTRGSAIRRAGYSGLRRNVAIALGNWLAESDAPDPEAVGELVAALSGQDPVVAEAAAGALGRAGR